MSTFWFIFWSFFLFGLVSNFPLKECDAEKKEIVFVLDCIDSVIEQIDFIQQTEQYLRQERNWNINSRTYVTFKEDGLTQLDVKTFNSTELHLNTITSQCSNETDVDTMFERINNFFTQERSTLKISFVLLKRTRTFFHNNELKKNKTRGNKDGLKLIAEKSKTEKSFHRNHFFINDLVENKLKQHTHIHYVDSFSASTIYTIFPLVCDLKCTKTKFKHQNSVQKSFYHLGMKPNMSHDQAIEFCLKDYNSYLVSIETYTEFKYLMSEIKKDSKNYDNFDIRLGLKWNSKHIPLWASRNPFLFYNNFPSFHRETCFYMTSDIMRNNPRINEINQSTMWNWFKFVGCKEKLENSVIICECHYNPRSTTIHFEPPNLSSSLLPLPLHDFYFLIRSIGIEIAKNKKIFHFINKNVDISTQFKLDHERELCLSKDYTDIYLSKNLSFSSEFVSKQCISKNGIFHYDVKDNVNLNDVCLFLKENNVYFYYCFVGSSYRAIINNITTDHNITEHSQSLTTRLNKLGYNNKCLRLKSTYRKDNSNLQNCENFSCPPDYFKCPNSFFVPIKEVNDRYNDCPFGEDEMLFTPERKMCKAYVTYLFKDMCFKNNRQAELLHLKDYKKYNNCAIENCYSFNTINENNTNEAILFQIPTELYNISNYFMYLPRPYVYPTIINIIGFYANSCKIKRFDQAFQTWKLSELVVLDISRNDITNSSQIQTIRDFSSLTLLNMSFNENFKVQKDFLLPNSIEILDLSHTGIESMPKYFFQKLRHLKYLNLSHTMILEFQHIGIPEYFHLDSLDLRGVEFTYLKADFFKGLTIRHILRSSDYKICCPQVLNVNITRDKCEAPDDVISSCSHLIGDTFKQIVIWIVGLVTFIGNSIVLIYWLGWDKRFLGKPYGLFIIGLAVSDFLMGIYLLIIAATDIYYRDNFVLEDIQWRYSHVCYFAGFLATLSSETSTFFICLATLDRLLIVKFPHGQLRITKRLKWSFFILSWLIGFVFALTPVIVTDWEIYSSNGLCLPLPLSSKRYQGWQYSVAIFVILNFLLFLLITLGQAAIFISFRYQNIFLKSGRNCEAMKSRELTVAKKLALVALSDFLCWFPVGILGMLSLNGQLFDNEVYAWVAVFVLPVNSALNPIIYTIPVVVTRLRSYVVNESQEIKPKKK